MTKTSSKTRSDNQGLKALLNRVYLQRYLFLMSVPFIIWAIIFRYVPLYGWTMAFQEFRPGRGFFEQQWVGLAQFQLFLSDPLFWMVLRNTLVMSVLALVCGYTLPVIFALMLNEIRMVKFKRIVQTISYLPHFVSWVVVASIFTRLLATDGVVNDLLVFFRILDEPVQFLARGEYFWAIATIAEVWKTLGWSAIVFLAAMTAIDPALYEAADVDGAGRFTKIWHITLPGIRTTYIVLLIMSIGWITSIGFERQLLLGNVMTMQYAYVLDLYVLSYGLQLMRFSFGTAVGMANSVLSITLLFLANRLAKKFGEATLV